MTTPTHTIPAVGTALGVFLAVNFILCTLFGLYVPGAKMYEVWLPLLPGVTWISWSSALLGTIESFAWGWYIALLFLPLLRAFDRLFPATASGENL